MPLLELSSWEMWIMSALRNWRGIQRLNMWQCVRKRGACWVPLCQWDGSGGCWPLWWGAERWRWAGRGTCMWMQQCSFGRKHFQILPSSYMLQEEIIKFSLWSACVSVRVTLIPLKQLRADSGSLVYTFSSARLWGFLAFLGYFCYNALCASLSVSFWLCMGKNGFADFI